MVKRMPFLLLFYGPFLFLFVLQVQIVSTKTIINNLQFRLNSSGQFELGRNSSQCLSVKADFSNKFRLKKPAKGQVQIFSETCSYTSSQMFRQIAIDENDVRKFNGTMQDFAICLEKYYKVYGKNDSILNNFYCLFVNNKGLLKLSPRLKKYADVVSKTELHWSLKNVQDDSFSEFFNTKKKNYLYTTKNDKIRAFSEASDQMIEFRKLLSARNRVSISGPCNTNPCQNNAECKNDQSNNSFVCNCPDGFNGDLCENDINDCKENPCKNSGMCIDRINSFVCKCADNWGGHLCETKVLTRQLVLSNPRFPNGTFRWDRAPGNLIDGKWLTERGYENFAETHEGRIFYVDLPSTIINVTDIIVYPKQEQGFWRYESMVVSIDDDENPCVTYQKLDAKSVQATKETGIIFHCYGKSGTKIVLDMSLEYKLHLSEIIAYGYDLNDPCNDHICNSDTSSDCIVDEDGMPYCDCLPGWEGIQCEINIDDCLGHDLCQNDSLCQDEVNGYTCLCPAGFEGEHCEIDVDDCISNNCQNGSICIDDIDSYVCQCDVGWEGQFCESNIDDCTGDPCQNSGSCVDELNDYSCICPAGFTGKDCEINIDDCLSNDCQNNSSCIDGVNSYTCRCDTGWEGKYCALNIDDCLENPCQNSGKCFDEINGYTCYCPAGFDGDHCENNINDCEPDPCVNGAICEDRIASFLCHCKPGFKGQLCHINVNDCSSNPCWNGGRCIDGVNSFSCACVPGFLGELCQFEINECDTNPCKNGAQCVDGLNEFTCRCDPGWKGELCDQSIDDCNSNDCLNGGICIDGHESYTCECPLGWAGEFCETSANKCDDEPCKNGGICEEGTLRDTFTCVCPLGFKGRLCNININECLIESNGTVSNACHNSAECIDGINSFSCNCKPGWSGDLCDFNIDECSVNPCQNGVCIDEVNGYTCQCSPGFSGDLCEVNINECLDNYFCLNGSSCIDQINGFTCNCLPGFDGEFCGNNIDDCAGDPCKNGKCIDGIESYECKCNTGWVGRNCDRNIRCDPNPCQHGGLCRPTIDGSDFTCDCKGHWTGPLCTDGCRIK